MCLHLCTIGWPASDQVAVAMGMCGRNLLLLRKNLPIQPPSWQTGQPINGLVFISAECSWVYSIAPTFFHTRFQVVLEDTRIWRFYLVLSCATSSIASLQNCLVGVRGVKKVVRMDSQLNSTQTCGKLSFRDVVLAGVAGARDGCIHGDGRKAHVQQVCAVRGKENLQPLDNVVPAAKSKRKYVRKDMSIIGREGTCSMQDNCSTKRVDRAEDGCTSLALRPKRKYVRKTKPVEDTPCVATESARGRSRQRRQSTHARGRGRRSYGNSCGGGDSNIEEYVDDPVPVDSRAFSPPLTRARINQPQRVSVMLRDLLWGGEVLPVPCPSAIGTVLDGEQVRDKSDLLQVDFGVYLGTQIIPRAAVKWLDLARALPSEGVVDSVVLPHEHLFIDAESRTSLHEEVVPSVEPADSQGAVGWELADSDSAYDWDPDLSDIGSEDNGYSSGASSVDVEHDDPMALLGELGIYPCGPEPQVPDLTMKYSESNWHARTWSLLPREVFSGKTPGASLHLPAHVLLQPIEYFILFWDEVLQRKIVRESNSYADYIDPATGKRKGGDSVANPITLAEYRQFTGICCLMGVRDQPSIRDYWRRGHGALFCEDVANTMSRYRFEYILRCLHMTSKQDFVTDKHSPQYDPIGKCRWILEHVQLRFQKFWNLSPFVTVDECMVAYNGRFCSFKQYLPAKPITHGIKIWAMACSVTSYVYRLEIYVGKDNKQSDGGAVGEEIGMAGQVVSRLTRGLEGLWYTVTCDNYFTSPYLFDDLLTRGFYAVGTARKQRKGFPTSLGISHDQPRGTLHVRVHKDRRMAAIHWQDTKGVYFLSIAADPMVRGGIVTSRVSGHRIAEVPTSPIQILYSQKMGGVDVGDQNRSYYSTQISTKKWWHRVYFFCLDSALANSFTIHKEISRKLGEKPLSHKEFQLRVAYALMERPYRARVAERTAQQVARAPPRHNDGLQSHVPRKTNLRRVCYVCKRRTFQICEVCNGVRLCTPECFEFFHNRGTRL